MKFTTFSHSAEYENVASRISEPSYLPMRHVNLKIFGEVQGTSFRYGTKQTARDIGIFGFVENKPDGSVYAEAEGEEGAVEKFVGWCKTGPKYARVDRVEVVESSVQGFTKFEIRYGGLIGKIFGE